MSRRSNLEIAGINTASDVRQDLVRELALLESFDKDCNNAHHHRNKLMKKADDLFVESLSATRERSVVIATTSSSAPSPNLVHSSTPTFRAGLCIEGALADTDLSTANREIAREEAALRLISKTQKEKQRLKDQIQLIEERVEWAGDLIHRQEKDARETLELLAASRFVETERKERSRKQREKVDEAVEEYLAQRQLVDDLHSSALEDRWLTRDQVLREAAAIREAREQVERDWRRDREHVFLDEDEMFSTH